MADDSGAVYEQRGSFLEDKVVIHNLESIQPSLLSIFFSLFTCMFCFVSCTTKNLSYVMPSFLFLAE